MIQTAQRMENLPFSGIRVMMERANQMQKMGEDVIHMEIGLSPTLTPPRSSRTPPMTASAGAMCSTPPTTEPRSCARPSPRS